MAQEHSPGYQHGYNPKDPLPTIQPAIRVERGPRFLHVTCPFDEKTRRRFKALGGRWNPEERKWLLNLIVEDKVLEALFTRYGWAREERDPPLIPVEIFLLRDIKAGKDAISPAGVVLAKAENRDSGARTGYGVSLVRGKIGSGGTRKYWESQATAGSVWRCHSSQGQIDILHRHPDLEITLYPTGDEI